MSDGRYILVSNSHQEHRNHLTLVISDDGMVFYKLYYLVDRLDEPRMGVDYPHIIEHDGYLYIAHSGGLGGRKQSVEVQRVRISNLDDLHNLDIKIHEF